MTMTLWSYIPHGKREHLCVASFSLHPSHPAAAVRQKLLEVAYASPFLQLKQSVKVVASELPWGTQYLVKVYPIDGRDEFEFTADLTVRGKEALGELGVAPATAPVSVARDNG